jgi:hypothetical protein
MTPDEQHKLSVLAAQQAEDAFAQRGLHLTTDQFNYLADFLAELVRHIVEDGPDA